MTDTNCDGACYPGECVCTIELRTEERDEARILARNLSLYTEHGYDCERGLNGGPVCTCGLDDLLLEVTY